MRDRQLERNVRRGRTNTFEIDRNEITIVFADFRMDSDGSGTNNDAAEPRLNIVEPRYAARGFASNVVEPLRDDIPGREGNE